MTDIKTLIEARAASDPRLKAVLKKIKEGTATFKDTAYYAEVYSSITGKVFSANVLDLVETEREEVCEELLRGNYEEINNICAQVQTALDEAAGIHIKPQRAAFPADRVDQIAHSLLDPTVKDSVIKRRANTGVANVSQGFHDSYIKVNASFRNDAGLKVHINRETDGKCCEWCTKIAGRYFYGTEPDDIYRRHDNCGCTVTYENGKQRQDVWSKRSWTSPEVGAGAPPPTRFTPEQAAEIQARNMPQRLTNGQKNGIINTGGKIVDTGGKITDKNFNKALEYEEQAKKFYDARVRSGNSDVELISENTGFKYKDVLAVKEHLMIESHLFDDGSTRKFEPNIDQALAWQRMMENRTTETDMLLLKHELRELRYMRKTGCTYEKAHAFSNQKYDWQTSIDSLIDNDNLDPELLK
ncbi:hypothetical protein [Ruminococcus flavefaciens]|uniref:hypothetical protein n=1 Tax=Ruminococcus flavefaciens TaxID=1265 RepID=UPI0026ECFE15|nr:hypothetical protein [Ruminococcus flavefaciens]